MRRSVLVNISVVSMMFLLFVVWQLQIPSNHSFLSSPNPSSPSHLAPQSFSYPTGDDNNNNNNDIPSAPPENIFRPTKDYSSYHKHIHIALITLDTTRFDSTTKAHIPNFKKIMERFSDSETFNRVNSQGTYTLPSHMSMLVAGILPSNLYPDPNEEKISGTYFRALPWPHSNSKYPLPAYAKNIPKGFEELGYRTVGIGGTRWFDVRSPTAAFWKTDFFQDFFYKLKKAVVLHDQIDALKKFKLRETFEKDGRYTFSFFNIREMHSPYYAGRALCNRTLNAHPPEYCPTTKDFAKRPVQELQVAALDYLDQYIPDILLEFPRPLHVIMVGDHGETFGEDGMWGHGFYHPKVMEVPFTSLMITTDDDEEFLRSLIKEQRVRAP